MCDPQKSENNSWHAKIAVLIQGVNSLVDGVDLYKEDIPREVESVTNHQGFELNQINSCNNESVVSVPEKRSLRMLSYLSENASDKTPMRLVKEFFCYFDQFSLVPKLIEEQKISFSGQIQRAVPALMGDLIE